MPTVLRRNGFRFMLFQGDAEHGPPHVHAIKAGAEVVINLFPVEVRNIRDMNRSDIRAAVRLVEDNVGMLLREWRSTNG